MTPFILQSIVERRLGLALHYPLLHAMVVGLDAKRTFEFGAGGSTRVILEALQQTGGEHWSVSTDERHTIHEADGADRSRWKHVRGESPGVLDQFPVERFDLVLHDGSHTAAVVAEEIAWAWPRLRPFGLLLVHDTQHSHCGGEMRRGLAAGLDAARAQYTATTLSYGFGLTIVRREEGGEGLVAPTTAKAGSAYKTELCEFRP